MKVVTVYFKEKPIYETLRRIYEESFSETMPGAELVVLEPKKPNRKKYNKMLDTAVGFIAAANYVIQQTEPCIVTDIDMMFLKPVTDVDVKNYDLAITTRNSRMKYNTGLWIYTPHAKKQVMTWRAYTQYYADNLTRLYEEIWSWGGIDQIALRDMLKTYPELKVLELPCQEWNAEQTAWSYVDNRTRVVHIKSKLRQAVEGKDINDPAIKELAGIAKNFLRGSHEKAEN